MMTQTKSKIRSSLKIAALMPLFGTLTLFLGCESGPSEYSEQEAVVKELSVEISDSETLKVNGNEMNISEFEEYLSKLTESPERVDLKVDSNAIMGVVTDVQKILRDHGILRINYSMNAKQSEEGLDPVKEYLKFADKYMKMKVEDTGYQILEREYDTVMKLYKAIQEAVIKSPDSPPPPPLVPSPEKRLKNALNGNDMPETLNSPPLPPVEKRNLLQILMNAQGQLLMNVEPASLGEVKNKIKQFVDNNGTNPVLSENPQEAIVSIKTERRTPNDLFVEMLDEVMAAYNELRDEAAQRRFGTTFSSLYVFSGLNRTT